MNNTDEWYKNAVFYQIYPRSFFDTTGTGVGDLNGITKKLDYVASLGVDAIWICPFFTSPMKDFGYDVSDYRDVDPMFGQLDDFRQLLDKAHRLGLKVIIDQILSHTSEEHSWFKESRHDRTNSKSDWYVWEDPRECGLPPNNWMARFGGPAWTYSIRRGQYYMHSFYASQPNLNLHNPDVRTAVLAAMKFWLDMGVDGFRMDAISFYMHDLKLRDNPASPEGTRTEGLHFTDPYTMQEHKYDREAPETMEFLKEIRALMDKYPGTMTIGEASGDCAEKTMQVASTYTAGNDRLHTAYSHSLIGGSELTPSFIHNFVETYNALPGESWPSWAFSNHDVIRAVTRFRKNKETSIPFAKMLLALLCSLRGTPFIYQGEELGLPEAQIPYEKLKDHWGIFLYPEWQGRDGARAPLPWRDELNAGFSTAKETWLPIPDEYRERSIELQLAEEHSVLNMCRSFLQWRKEQTCLQTGSMEFINHDKSDSLCFWRRTDSEELLCCFNFSDTAISIDLPVSGLLDPISGDATLEGNALTLPPYGYGFVRQ